MALKEGETLGPWLLGEKLGEGGNAVVFKATSDEYPEPVALKILKSRKPGGEPYRRFAAEVRVLGDIGDFKGVLPLLAADLPEDLAAGARPWLAMPLAESIRVALAEAPLDAVIQAMADVADTLSRLAVDHRLAHRDLKPANLYGSGDGALVGDFGLVALPVVSTVGRISHNSPRV